MTGRPDGHALSVERIIDASPEVIFDAFIALYDSRRPDVLGELARRVSPQRP